MPRRLRLCKKGRQHGAVYNVGAEKTLDRVLIGTADAAIHLDDLCQLLKRLGFEKRVRGSHHLFRRVGLEERYEVIIFWSEEDGVFIADVPELAGCMAHGTTEEEALSNS